MRSRPALAFVDAQNEYAEKDRGQGVGVYAQRIVSTTGKKDGLYWPGDDSPLGELAAQAAGEGYKVGQGPIPYHGYYFRVLTQQGPNAPGGTLDYVVKGKMIGGFALLAWPAEYGNSGVMTFLVNHSGVVYQKDLGNSTVSARQADELVRSRPDLEEGRLGEAIGHQEKRVRSTAGLHANAAEPGKLECRPAHVKAEHRAEEVYLKPFDPTDGEAEVAGE